MSTKAQTMKTVAALKQAGEDHEWYPTSAEILKKVADDIADLEYSAKSILDIGAGDGRVLLAIHKHLKDQALAKNLYGPAIDLYAIEKATTHLQNMPKEITVLGTAFEQQSLCDKPVSVLFSNPPYSEFAAWALRIIQEASANVVYLVIPRRWRDSEQLDRAIKARDGEVVSLGEFDFEDADRAARAKVEIVRIEFRHSDAFDSVIEAMLPELDIFAYTPEKEAVDLGLIVKSNRENAVEDLVGEYDRAMLRLLENYRAALKLDPSILRELGVTKENTLAAIRLKIKSLKDLFWQRLFDELASIRNRLATKQRKAFLDSLSGKFSVDFTAGNIYSVLIWVSKWANTHFDQQVIDLFRTLSNDSCVVRYKSNVRVWTKSGWRYNQTHNYRDSDAEMASHYKLEYRVVLTHGGISTSKWDWDVRQHRGLEKCAFELLNDIVTVANNLHFTSDDGPINYTWTSNKQHKLLMANGKPLAAVRAFMNGNMHIHFDPKLMLAINVEAGRLLGWIRNPAEACAEMGVPEEDASQVAEMFGSSFRIGSGDTCRLLTVTSNSHG